MNIQKMKLPFVVFICLISNTFSSSFQTSLSRVRRWGNGDMGAPSDLSNMFRGTAGVDYPDLKTIPNTNFRCEEQVYEGGLYADVETRCQVYHVCHDGRKDSFLCGKGTIFNQQILACDYWYSADCESAPNYYHLNSEIGESGSPNKLYDNNSQQGANHHNLGNKDNTGGNQRLPNTGGNPTGGHPRLPNTGGNPTGGHPRLPNTGGHPTGGHPRLPNTGGNPTGGYPGLPNTGGNPTGGHQRLPNTGGNPNQYDNPNQESCCCFKTSNKTPWIFPRGMMNGDK